MRPRPSHPATTLPLSRRAALSAGAAAPLLPALTACGDQATAGDGAGTAGPAEGDRDLLGRARDDVAALLGLARATRRRHPSLRRLLAATQDVHAAQLAALSGDAPAPRVPVPDVPRGPQDALTALRRAQDRARLRLVTLAVEASSGSLARLLAGTSAGVAQQLAVLPVNTPPAGSQEPGR